MSQNVKIVNVYKHNVVYKNVKNHNKKIILTNFSIIFIMLVSVLTFSQNLDVKNVVGMSDNDDYISAFIQSNDSGANIDNQINLPIKNSDYQIKDGNIIFSKTDSNIIYSPSSGVVSDISRGDKQKSVTIKIDEQIECQITGLKVIGVNKANIVKTNTVIGTSSSDNQVVVKIFQNEKQLKNIEIIDNKIIWKN